MSKDSSSALSRFNAAIASSSATAAITSAFRRFTRGAPPPPPPVPPTHQLPAGDPATDMARERARRSLLEARQAMSSMIVNVSPPPSAPAIEPVGGIAPDLEQLRSYLEIADRDRAELREEVNELRAAVESLRTRVDALERGQPSSPAVTDAATVPAEREATPPDTGTAAAEQPVEPEAAASAAPMPELTSLAGESAPATAAAGYDVLSQRTFAAGTIGTRIQLTPLPSEAQIAEILQRLRDEPLVEHVEPILQVAHWVELRITLRAPMRWEPFREILERAVGQPIAPERVAWVRGLLRITLIPRDPADGT